MQMRVALGAYQNQAVQLLQLQGGSRIVTYSQLSQSTPASIAKGSQYYYETPDSRFFVGSGSDTRPSNTALYYYLYVY